MIALLDINVLVALFDPAHCHHETAHAWLDVHKGQGWATCPITENGFVRVVSNAAYPGSRTSVADAIQRLRRFQESGDHTFWPDTPTLRDDSVFDARHIRGHQQITDVYLLALAVARRGRLATLDGRIRGSAVRGATVENLVTIHG